MYFCGGVTHLTGFNGPENRPLNGERFAIITYGAYLTSSLQALSPVKRQDSSYYTKSFKHDGNEHTDAVNFILTSMYTSLCGLHILHIRPQRSDQ